MVWRLYGDTSPDYARTMPYCAIVWRTTAEFALAEASARKYVGTWGMRDQVTAARIARPLVGRDGVTPVETLNRWSHRGGVSVLGLAHDITTTIAAFVGSC